MVVSGAQLSSPPSRALVHRENGEGLIQQRAEALRQCRLRNSMLAHEIVDHLAKAGCRHGAVVVAQELGDL